jgi:hypothetical protein
MWIVKGREEEDIRLEYLCYAEQKVDLPFSNLSATHDGNSVEELKQTLILNV